MHIHYGFIYIYIQYIIMYVIQFNININILILNCMLYNNLILKIVKY